MKTNEKLLLLAVVIALVTITGWNAGWFKSLPSPLVTIPGGGTGNGPWCGSIPGTAAIGSQPGTCFVQPQKLSILFSDFATGVALANTFYCTIRSAGGSTNTIPTGVAYESNIQLSSGLCNSANPYTTGQALYIEICKSSTCAYGATTTIWEGLLPSPGSAGAGLVAFATSNTCSSSTGVCTLSLAQPVTQVGAFSITAQYTNGTAVAGSATILNSGWANGPYGVASGVYKGQLIYTLTDTSTSTAPYGFGFKTYPEYEVNGRSLSSLLIQEAINTGGTGMDVVTSGLSTILTKTSTDVVYGTTPTDQSLTKQFDASGNTISSGVQVLTVSYDSTGLGTSASNINTINLTFYLFINIPYFTQYGVINSEAQSLATFTLTIKG